MFRNTALANTPTFKLILGFGLCTLGGAMLYAYFKQRDEDDENQKQQQNSSQKLSEAAAKLKSQKSQQAQRKVKIEFKIANEHVPMVAGRQGANLKSIQDRTQTTIHFR